MKILIVDDQKINRVLLQKLLVNTEHQLFLAENGQLAVEVYEQECPDLILMDIAMPVMGGIEAIQIIRSIMTEKWVQIIVVSALTDQDSVVAGLKAGADDYITKPFNTIILNAKISVLQRMVAMQDTLLENKQKLQQYHKQNELEQSFAQNVFEKIISQNELDDEQLDYWIKPSKKFSGDLISVKRVAPDQLYFLLADSTGHGLPAALPTIIVNQVFQRMSDKEHSISMIVREINVQLKQQIPVGHFVALAIGVVDSTRKEIKLWNGGLDTVLLLNGDNKVTHGFPSRHLACGVLSDEAFDDSLETIFWSESSELFLYSDGLTDVIDEKNALFGEQQLMNALLTAQAGQRLQMIKKAIMQYGDFNQEQDDISCLFVLCS